MFTQYYLIFIFYNVLLFYGRKQTSFLRTHKRWQPLIPLLIDNISVDPNSGTQDIYPCANPSNINCPRGTVVPIQAKIRTLSICLLYEVCRVQKLSYAELSKPP